jgi:hypothetical protein
MPNQQYCSSVQHSQLTQNPVKIQWRGGSRRTVGWGFRPPLPPRPPRVPFLPGLALAFDSQFQAGSATKIVGQACAAASGDKSMRLSQKRFIRRRKHAMYTYITDSISNANEFTTIYHGWGPFLTIETRDLLESHPYTSSLPGNVDYRLRRRATRRDVRMTPITRRSPTLYLLSLIIPTRVEPTLIA